MNKNTLVTFLVIASLFCFLHAEAQSNKTRTKKKPPTNSASNYFGNSVNAADTSKPGGGSASSNYFNSGADTTGRNQQNVPIEFVANTTNPLTQLVGTSARSESAYEQSVKDKIPLAYESIREDDAAFVVRVWRVIDAREKMNLVFRNPSVSDAGADLFLAILYNAVTDSLSGNAITAFRDDRFSQPYNMEDFLKRFSGGGYDTLPVYDLDGNLIRKRVTQRNFPVDSVLQYKVKEEWIFDKESSRLFVRILGIAPMMKTYTSNGIAISDQAFPLFWVYYSDLRPMLAKRQVYNPKNLGARMSWDDLFESRMFSSYIVQSSLDNPFDQPLSAIYPNNSLYRLLEGERIKDKIFNYEQNLWAY